MAKPINADTCWLENLITERLYDHPSAGTGWSRQLEYRGFCNVLCQSILSHTSDGGDRWTWSNDGMTAGREKPKKKTQLALVTLHPLRTSHKVVGYWTRRSLTKGQCLLPKLLQSLERLFICGLYNGAVSCSDYDPVTLNCINISKNMWRKTFVTEFEKLWKMKKFSIIIANHLKKTYINPDSSDLKSLVLSIIQSYSVKPHVSV
jgi:hypothetical protein